MPNQGVVDDAARDGAGAGACARIDGSPPLTPSLHRFVLTGGPCGGKTTAMAHLRSHFSDRGFQVAMCPEVFGILSGTGTVSQSFEEDLEPKVVRSCQNFMLDMQARLEDGLCGILAAGGKPSILLCDRGPLDAAAYVSAESWNDLLESRGQTNAQLRDQRYNAIFHLVTAADGAEACYTLDGNEVRYETPEQARAVDRRTQAAWAGHSQLYVIKNMDDGFQGKMQRLVSIMSRIVGLPEDEDEEGSGGSRIPRRTIKYLVRGRDGLDVSVFPPDVPLHRFKVEKVYLTSSDAQVGDDGDSEHCGYSFVRKRTAIGQMGENIDRHQHQMEMMHDESFHTVHQLTTIKNANGKAVEQKRIISMREYAATCHYGRDRTRYVVHQDRACFIYNRQSFTMHAYRSPCPGLCILHAHVHASDADHVDLPPFLNIERRIEGREDEERYSARYLSLVTQNA